MNDNTYFRLQAEADKVFEDRLAKSLHTTQMVHDSAKILRNVCSELLWLAQAFGETGNVVMERRLEYLAKVVFTEGHICVTAEGYRLRKDVDEGMRQLGETFVAVLDKATRG